MTHRGARIYVSTSTPMQLLGRKRFHDRVQLGVDRLGLLVALFRHRGELFVRRSLKRLHLAVRGPCCGRDLPRGSWAGKVVGANKVWVDGRAASVESVVLRGPRTPITCSASALASADTWFFTRPVMLNSRSVLSPSSRLGRSI